MQGTLRVLLVLLHDFPEFLCEYHFQLCNVIPPSCIQMRNLILSAFPRNMRLPDPFTPNLKVDLLPEINQSPRFVPEPQNLLPAELRYRFSHPSTYILLPSLSHLSRSYITLVLHLQMHRCCCVCICNTRVAYDLLMQYAFVAAPQKLVLSLSACTGCLVHSCLLCCTGLLWMAT